MYKQIVDPNRIDTVNDLLFAAAACVEHEQPDQIDDLKQINDNWLQDEESREAINAVLDKLQDLAYRVA